MRLSLRVALLVCLLAAAGCARVSAPRRPVAPATGLARAALSNPAYRWDSLAAPGLTVYVRAGSYPAAHAPALLTHTQDALRHALTLLGEPRFPPHLRVFYVGSRDEMTPITGTRVPGTTDAPAHAVVLVAAEDWAPFVRHEVMHAVSLVRWGQPGGADAAPRDAAGRARWRQGGWLREGLAAAAEDRCGPYTNRGVAAAMQAEGTLLPLDTLTGAFYAQDDFAAYLQAGSLVQFLLARYGRAPFRRLWRAGGGAVEAAYGTSAAGIEAAWRAWLAETPPAARPSGVAALRARGCGART